VAPSLVTALSKAMLGTRLRRQNPGFVVLGMVTAPTASATRAISGRG
jgi:hypothetical protein